jgi:predicted DsbA family dithiol-disulfide isomerase
MKITYFIDYNCPYSYIGLQRIRKACESLDLDAEWEMRPFEIEPQAGKRTTVSITERYAEKYEISMDDASKKISEIEEAAREDGLEMNFRDITLTSSKDPLRFTKYVQNDHPDLSLDIVEEIFKANMVENINLTNIDRLVEIAVSCGVEETDARKILENNYFNIDVFRDMEDAIASGITTTPCFILEEDGSETIIREALSTEEFAKAISDLIGE